MQKTALEHDLQKLVEKALALGASGAKTVRSEEHTSKLQSL